MRPRSFAYLFMAAVILSIVLPRHAAAQNPIKIGFIYCFSGRLAHYGFGAKQGAELILEQINRAGGINGRRVTAVYGDTELNPEVGVRAAEKLVREDRVDVVMGIVSSGVARAVAPVMNQLRTPLIITLAMTPDVTGTMCNPYTFRISLNGPQNLRGAAILASGLDVRKWTTLGPDYIFGYQCWEYFQKYLKDLKPDATFAGDKEIAYAPVDTRDFKSDIRKVVNSGADGILVSLYGGNLVDFIRQGQELKIFDKGITFLCNLAYSGDVMYGLGLEMPKGLWLSGLYWFQANRSPINLEFVESYSQRYRIFPDYNAHGAYAGILAYRAAVEKAGSTDKHAVIAALEGLTLDIPAGRVTIRHEDHQAVVDGVWGVSGEFSPKYRSRLLRPMKVFPGSIITRPFDETGCLR